MKERKVLKEKQVLIPVWLFHDIIDLLDQWHGISAYPENIKSDYYEIMGCLLDKLVKLRLHDSYSRIIYAKTDEQRENARLEYLRRKYL